MKLPEAEDWLADEPLKYMEASYNKVLQDINYDKLQLKKNKIFTTRAQRKIRDARLSKQQLV